MLDIAIEDDNEWGQEREGCLEPILRWVKGFAGGSELNECETGVLPTARVGYCCPSP